MTVARRRSFVLPLIISIVFLFAAAKKARAQETVSPGCSCTEKFNSLYKKLVEDYIGYHLDKAKRDSFEAMLPRFMKLAQTASELDCEKYMQQSLDIFHDGHLFTITFPAAADTLLKQKFINDMKMRRVSVADIFSYFKKTKNLSPVEGLYTDGSLFYAIMKSRGSLAASSQYAGFLFSKDAKSTDSAGLKLTLDEMPRKNNFDGMFLNRFLLPRYTRGFLYKNNESLALWGGLLWHRIELNDVNALRNMELTNPYLPTIKKIDSETVWVDFPSFLADRHQFDSVMNANHESIVQCKYLIIDLRGNIGGNNIYKKFLENYTTVDSLSGTGSSLVLASPDNYTYYKGVLPDSTDPMLTFLQQKPGKIYTWTSGGTRIYTPAKNNIEKVAILTDGGDMSAAEAFILQSKHLSDKVITIGEPTGGVIDYTSINTVKLSCPQTLLGYPTGTIHEKIPLEGYNQTGLIPDFPMPVISLAGIMAILRKTK